MNDLNIRDYKGDKVNANDYTTSVGSDAHDLIISFNNKDYAEDYSIQVVDAPSYIKDTEGKLAVKSDKYVTEFNKFTVAPSLNLTTTTLKTTSTEIKGKTTPGAEVKAKDGSTELARATADANGDFTLDVTNKLVAGKSVVVSATKMVLPRNPLQLS